MINQKVIFEGKNYHNSPSCYMQLCQYTANARFW